MQSDFKGIRSAAVFGAGFIGKHLIKSLVNSGTRVYVYDRNDCPCDLSGVVNWVKSDFRSTESFAKFLTDVEVVYHLISSTFPGDEAKGFPCELKDNVVSILRLIDSSIKSGVRKFIFASSSSVYGVSEYSPLTEDSNCHPISFHGIHKTTIEQILMMKRQIGNFDARVLRISNAYGPGQNINGRQGFVAIAIKSLIDKNPLIVRDGASTVRDFIYISDITRALHLAGIVENAPPIMNIGSGIGNKLNDVIELLRQGSKLDLTILAKNLRPFDIPVSILDIKLARESIGFAPRVELAEGLFETLRYHQLMKQSE